MSAIRSLLKANRTSRQTKNGANDPNRTLCPEVRITGSPLPCFFVTVLLIVQHGLAVAVA
jgi:hypothetical protein